MHGTDKSNACFYFCTVCDEDYILYFPKAFDLKVIEVMKPPWDAAFPQIQCHISLRRAYENQTSVYCSLYDQEDPSPSLSPPLLPSSSLSLPAARIYGVL